MSPLRPCLDSLPAPQRQLWADLRSVPADFILYGGTALALRLGHRRSVDFDFFSASPFDPEALRTRVPWLSCAETLQAAVNTLTVAIRRGEVVKVSFFGGLTLGRTGWPQLTEDGVLRVASLLDLAATKLAVIQQRAEKRDYLDIAAILRTGMDLGLALGAARSLYRDRFNPMISLKALSYFRDGDLPELPAALQQQLSAAAGGVTAIPDVARTSDSIA